MREIYQCNDIGFSDAQHAHTQFTYRLLFFHLFGERKTITIIIITIIITIIIVNNNDNNNM